MATEVSSENVKETDHLRDQGTHNKIIFKRIKKIGCECRLDSNSGKGLVNTVMKLRVP
jgi:hypothetical protein